MHPPVAPTAVHGESQRPQCDEALLGAMQTRRHRSDDLSEDDEVALLRAEEWLRLEERDHLRQKVFPTPYHQHQRGV